jgi:hypothetical protein
MTARIKFEDLQGKPLGYVDQKGDKLVGSNKSMEFVIDDFMNIRPDADSEEFLKYYGTPSGRASYLFSKLVDSDDDKTEYPE